jgi:hypothetical protein
VSASGQTLFVLVTGPPDTVAVLDARTLLVRARVPLEPVVRYRALLLAPTGDRLHVFGNRAGRVVDTVNQLREEAAVVTSVDLTSHARSVVTVREADGRSWFVYWAAFSVDGTRLVATYHGGSRHASIWSISACWVAMMSSAIEMSSGWLSAACFASRAISIAA